MSANVSALASKAKRKAIVGSTLHWWDRCRRALPWRAAPGETPDAYRVWLSEVLLQQTTAQAATPYYQAFIAKWPRVEDLAAAAVEDVMSAFAGLGYYSRARNLHACAKEIAPAGRTISERGGGFTRASGRWRLYRRGCRGDRLWPPDSAGRRQYRPRSGAARRGGRADRSGASEIASAAQALAPRDRAGDFAQALMDIGAILCRPRNPDCGACPLAPDCAAFRTGTPEAYPRRTEAKARPSRQGAVFFARRSDGAFLARRRPPHGLLAATIELPGTPWTSKGADSGLAGAAPVAAHWRRLPGEVEQVFTHFALRLTVYAAEFEGGAPADCFWVKPDAVGAAGFSSMMRKAVEHALART